MVLDLLQPIHPILDVQVNLGLLKMVPNDFSNSKTLGSDTKIQSLASSQTKSELYTLKWPWPPTAHFWSSGQLGGPENSLKWFLIPKNMMLDTKIKSLAWSEAELLNYSLKWSLTSYRHYFSFLMFRSIWGFWKWSQMISHTQKHGDRHQNQVSSITTSKVRNLHPEGVLDHIWFLIPQTMGIDTKIKSLAYFDILGGMHFVGGI